MCGWAVSWIQALSQVRHSSVDPSNYIKKIFVQKLLKCFMNCGQGFDVSQIILRCDSEWEEAAGLIATAAHTDSQAVIPKAQWMLRGCLKLFFHCQHMACT